MREPLVGMATVPAAALSKPSIPSTTYRPDVPKVCGEVTEYVQLPAVLVETSGASARVVAPVGEVTLTRIPSLIPSPVTATPMVLPETKPAPMVCAGLGKSRSVDVGANPVPPLTGSAAPVAVVKFVKPALASARISNKLYCG